MKFHHYLVAAILFFNVSNLNAQAPDEVDSQMSTKVFLTELFQSGMTFDDITEEGDAFFKLKYPTTSFSDLCIGEYRDGDFVKYQRWCSFWNNHLNEDGTIGDFTLIKRNAGDDRGARAAVCDDSDSDVEWTNVNYNSNMGLQIDQGRTSSIAFHPSDPQTYYVGAAWGGLWKTTDGGLSHSIVNDDLPLAAVSGIVIDPLNPNNIAVTLSDIVWYGPTGVGVFVSNDGGVTFSATDIAWDLNDYVRIYYMDQDPSDGNSIIIATSDGLFKTTDFFTTSLQVLSANMTSVKYSQSNPDIVYAGGSSGQFFRSDDSGDSFSIIDDFGTEQVRIAVSRQPGSDNIAVTSGVFLQTSTDNGLTFTPKDLPESNMVVEFEPGSETVLNVGNFEVHRSDNFGDSFYAVSHWLGDGGLPFIHVDQRNVFVNPLSDDEVYFCNDGGVFRYDNGTNSFANLSTDMIITQYYDIAVSASEAEVLGGGSQDNGNIFRSSDGSWDAYAQTGDGMGQDIDPDYANRRYWSYQYGSLRRWEDGSNTNIAPAGEGGDGAWETPFKLDPSNSNRILVGYSSVYASDNYGDTWEELGDPVTAGANLEQLAIAPSNPDKVYATQNRNLYVKEPGSSEWTLALTPVFTTITDLEVDPLDEDIVYISYGGYFDGKKVYKSEDSGENWTNITAGLPNLPVMSLELYYDEPGGVFVGTYGAVYYLDDMSEEWRKYGCLPHTSVSDIEIQYATDRIFAGTHGRGIFEAPIEIYVSSIDDNSELNQEKLSLYPNPAINSITIKSSELKLGEIEMIVTDMTGRVIEATYSIDINGDLNVDCSGLRQGNYLIKITDDTLNRYVLRFSKL